MINKTDPGARCACICHVRKLPPSNAVPCPCCESGNKPPAPPPERCACGQPSIRQWTHGPDHCRDGTLITASAKDPAPAADLATAIEALREIAGSSCEEYCYSKALCNPCIARAALARIEGK